ncbi:helix-turn-helix transcriptional regulator [Rhodobacteraceae bacterium D3-12]|nr:helix-turn-helix transcriptional regulator [Rhodobacteraceae bacterium D3-12]
MKWNDLDKESCPIARGLSVIGDRWTLLILRDLFFGLRRFDELQASLGITRHLLADRLKKLEADGVLARRPYQTRPPRHEYRLTDAGKELAPVLLSIWKWSETHVASDQPSPIAFALRDTGVPLDPVLVQNGSSEPLQPRNIQPIRLTKGKPKGP